MATRHVQASRRIGFDIGGTFTDFILVDDTSGALHLHKCLTTPEDPSIGALAGMTDLLRAAGLGLAEVGHVVHGTTLVTNAIIERSGARLGLLTTRGFRDVLQMGTEQRYDIHDLFLAFPEPLAARRDRREIAERVSRDGAVLEALDPEAVRREVRELVDDGVEALAICFLHAYKNPVHERAARDLVEAEFPGPAGVDLERRPPADQRVRTFVDHDRERLRAAAHVRLRPQARPGAAGAGLWRALPPHPVLGRIDRPGDRPGAADPVPRVRSGGGCPGERPRRKGDRP